MDNSSPKIYTEFLPISRADMEARGWDQLDFVVASLVYTVALRSGRAPALPPGECSSSARGIFATE